jgi:hypothetical protein
VHPEFSFSRHARETMAQRDIDPRDVESVFDSPEQIVPGYGGLRIYQSRLRSSGDRLYLLRVVVNHMVDPSVVVTVYRTSRVSKYWRADEGDV